MGFKPYLSSEDDFIKANYNTLGRHAVGAQLNRSSRAAFRRALFLGVAEYERPGRARILTVEEKEHITLRWHEHKPLDDLAREMRIDINIISQFARTELPDRNEIMHKVGCLSRYTDEQIAEMLRLYSVEMLPAHEVAKIYGCTYGLVTFYARRAGVDSSYFRGEKMHRMYMRGGWTRPAASKRGIPTPIQTPFQGQCLSRSRTEAFRAEQLTTTGMAWFYEVHRFKLQGDRKSYMPDFWLTTVPVAEAQVLLGTNPTAKEIRAFLDTTEHWIEDTKGWFHPQERSWGKLHTFKDSHPNFSVVVLHPRGNPRRIFNPIPDILEDPRFVGIAVSPH